MFITDHMYSNKNAFNEKVMTWMGRFFLLYDLKELCELESLISGSIEGNGLASYCLELLETVPSLEGHVSSAISRHGTRKWQSQKYFHITHVLTLSAMP